MRLWPLPMQGFTVALFAIFLCCVFGLDDRIFAPFHDSPRVLLAFGLLLWLRVEWLLYPGRGVQSNTQSSAKMVKENYELSQSVMNLSDQHKLLCEIRTSVLKASKYSRDVLLELQLSLCCKCSSSSKSSRRGSVDSSPQSVVCASPKSMPDEDFSMSPLTKPIDQTAKAKAAFRRGSMSMGTFFRVCIL